jgi:SAM-dependent methyltransferase
LPGGLRRSSRSRGRMLNCCFQDNPIRFPHLVRRMNLPILLPHLPGCNEAPVWQGSSFAVGAEKVRILNYGANPTGWTDELTEIHEDVDDEHHFINVASREHAVGRVMRWVRGDSPIVLDVGCSSGYTIKLLRQRLPNVAVAGADCVMGPLENLGAAMPDVPLLRFDLVTCPLPDNGLDAVISLNVLEHIEDDQAAVQQMHRILKPGGVAVIEVPAGPELYVRRYRMRDVLELVRRAGFRILERSHLGFFIYPGFWLVKKRNRRHVADPPERQREIVAGNMRQNSQTPMMHAVMRLEERLRGWLYYPFGIRCLVTCQKPEAGKEQRPKAEPR